MARRTRSAPRRSGKRDPVEGDVGLVEAPGDAMPTTDRHRRFLDAPIMDRHARRRAEALPRSLPDSEGTAQVAAAGASVAADRFAHHGRPHPRPRGT